MKLFGGQLVAPASSGTWFSFIMKILGGLLGVYILYLAFLKPCPKPPVKEPFCGSCPKKRT